MGFPGLWDSKADLANRYENLESTEAVSEGKVVLSFCLVLVKTKS